MTATPTVDKGKIELKGQLVNTLHVDRLISTYKNERWLQNSERLGKSDSLSTWYGLPELEAFLQIAKENNANGIKFYFGVYPNDYEPVPEFQGRQTVVLVATKEKLTEQGSINKDIYLSNGEKYELLAFNLGFICPPFCNNLDSLKTKKSGIEIEKVGISVIKSGDKIIII